MCSSAIASSSPVLTPGRTAAQTALIAPAVTSPEARMSSISCGVLIWIMRPLHFPSSGTRSRIPAAISGTSALGLLVPGAALLGLPERGHRALGDLLDGADRIDPREQA